MKKLCLIILAFFFLLSACDTQKYYSYNYDANEFSEIASFSGRVTDLFTGESVPYATVQIENQSVVADLGGNYRLDYVLSKDAKLSKQIDIVVSAQNYLPNIQTQSIFAGVFPLDIELEYGAPIIEATVFYELSICQAIIFDYQGTVDIDSVTAHFQYYGENNTIIHEFDTTLVPVRTVSPNRAHYQIVVESVSPLYGQIDNHHIITVFDKNGFSDSEIHKNDPKHPDPLIFPLDSLLVTD